MPARFLLNNVYDDETESPSRIEYGAKPEMWMFQVCAALEDRIFVHWEPLCRLWLSFAYNELRAQLRGKAVFIEEKYGLVTPYLLHNALLGSNKKKEQSPSNSQMLQRFEVVALRFKRAEKVERAMCDSDAENLSTDGDLENLSDDASGAWDPLMI
ncbi:MAG: hypothetical protein Q9162_006567 [Coniocarpon cinnabarinum]